MTDPDRGAWSYQYDPNGNLTKQTDVKGQTLTLSYDALDRLTGKSSQGAAVAFQDSFDSQQTAPWVWNGQQTVPYPDGGQHVVRNTGANADWSATFYRSSATLTDGKAMQVRLKVDSDYTAAHFSIYADDATRHQRFGAIADRGKLFVQYTRDGATWHYPADLLNPLQPNTWYVLQIGVDDQHGFTVEVYREDHMWERAVYSMQMPAGKRWRFRHWIWRNTAYLDDYREFSGAIYAYDEPFGGFALGQRTAMRTASTATLWNYDERGRPRHAHQTAAGLNTVRTVDWGYDSADRVSRITYPDGETASYRYDAAGRPRSVCSDAAPVGCLISNAQWTALDQPREWTRPSSGHIQRWSYTRPMARLGRFQVGASTQA
ncbi:MAG: RHS repeat protein, partial [Chloroflexales bacterium]|nr:RHS repeat protein [Chloroflexales bacterium]